ncbi:MAG: PDZ domain-containing protein [Bdellovibrionota bacterium]
MVFLVYLLTIPVALGAKELGSLILARLLGVRLFRLGLGLGPALFRFNLAGVRAHLSPYPFSLVAGLKGSSPEAQEALAKKGEAAQGLFAKGYGTRLAVSLAGAVGCGLLAWALLLLGGLLNPPPAGVVGGVTRSTPAEDAALKAGDRIVMVNGKPVVYLFDLFKDIYDSAGAPVEVELERGKKRLKVQLETAECFGPSGEFYSDRLGIEAPSLTRVARVLPGQPAEQAGLKEGDWIREVAGQPVEVWAQVVDAVQAHPSEEIGLVVERGGARQNFKVTPQTQIWRDPFTGKPILDENGNPQMRALIGAVGDMGRLFGAERSVASAASGATQQSFILALAIPARLLQFFVPDTESRRERDRPTFIIDIEQGLIETARPWYRSAAEVLLLSALLLFAFSFYEAAQGRGLVEGFLGEEG